MYLTLLILCLLMGASCTSFSNRFLVEKHQADLIWLQNNTDPWAEVEETWRKTFNLRRETQYDSLHDFVNEWKILNDQRSDSFINIDFDLIYPNKGLNFYLNWDKFYKKIIALKPTQNEEIRSIINTIDHLEDDLKIHLQIYVLGHLISPKGRLNKKIKFSIQKAIDSIFVCAKTAGDIDSIITAQKEKAALNKLSVQPYIILQGPMKNCSSPLLVIDNVKYYYTNIRKAFDTLFKVYHVLHAIYPRSSDHLYLIIQRCVYHIETKYDNVVPYIADILKIH